MKKLVMLGAGITALLLVVSALSNNQTPAPSAESAARASQEIPGSPEEFNSTSLKVHNLDLSKGNTISLFEEVNNESAARVIQELAKYANSNQPTYLLLDSPGGSVIQGTRIITAMQASKAPVYTVCLNECASMAAMILEYGKERYAVDRSIIMFHPASISGMINGELDKMVSRYSFLKRYVDKMDYFTASRAGMSYDAFKAKSSREYWVDAEDALRNNLIDKVVRVNLQTKDMLNVGNNHISQELDDFRL